jgi:hypothetical protein
LADLREEVFRALRDDEQFVAALGDESRRHETAHGGEQAVPETVHVQHADRFGVQGELGRAPHVEKLVERAESAGERDRRVRHLQHALFAPIHGVHDLQRREPGVRQLFVDQALGDHAVHFPARRERRVRDHAHQPTMPAAVDDLHACLGELPGEGLGRFDENGVRACARAAVDGDPHAVLLRLSGAPP